MPRLPRPFRRRRERRKLPLRVGLLLFLGVMIVLGYFQPSTPRLSGAPGETVTGRVSHVRDGDTIEVSGIPIRLGKFNCAETGTEMGDRATRYMRRIVRGERLECQLSGRMSYDRHIGTCSIGDRSLASFMVGDGYCLPWR